MTFLLEIEVATSHFIKHFKISVSIISSMTIKWQFGPVWCYYECGQSLLHTMVLLQVCLSTPGEDTSDVPYQNSSNLQPPFLCHDWHVTLGGGITPRYALILCPTVGISHPSTCVIAICLLSRGPIYGDSTLLGRSVGEVTLNSQVFLSP